MNMSVLGVSGPPPEIPAVVSERDKSDRRIVVVLITLFISLVVGGIGTVIGVWAHYALKFGTIDRYHESLSWDPDISHATSTTFDSPAYGVTLKLPGKWGSTQETSADICHLLRADRRFNVLVRPRFPSFAPPGAIAAQVVNRFRSMGWIVKSEDSASVSGLPAEDFRLLSPKGVEVDEIIVQKLPVVYVVVVSGPPSDTDSWQRSHDALSRAISIR